MTHGPKNVKFPGTCCLHFQGKWIWFRGMLKWSGSGTVLLTHRGCKDLGQPELWNTDSGTHFVPCQQALESAVRQVAIFRSTNIKNSHWLDTPIPASSFHSSDWPKSLQSSYIINISLPLNNFNIHLNQTQSPWRCRQHIPLKCTATLNYLTNY